MSMFQKLSGTRVTYGPLPLFRLWDACPRAGYSSGAILGFDGGSGDGHTIIMRLWIKKVLGGPLTNTPPSYRPASAPFPPFLANGNPPMLHSLVVRLGDRARVLSRRRSNDPEPVCLRQTRGEGPPAHRPEQTFPARTSGFVGRDGTEGRTARYRGSRSA